MKTPARNLSCNRYARAKKFTTFVISALCAITMFSVTAFADVDVSEFISTTAKVLKGLIYLIGAGFGFFGVINLLDAHSNDNAASKSTGIKQIMAGIAMISAAALLVPVLEKMMTGAMS